MDRERLQRCLEQVAAYRTSGQKADTWARANDVPLRALASWCAHARRWQAQLDGVSVAPGAGGPGGFVATRVASTAPASGSGTVRIELQAGVTRIELHWPLAHTRELAAWLREVGR